MYTRVSSFLHWINATILSNGGLASCNFSLTALPSQGKSHIIQVALSNFRLPPQTDARIFLRHSEVDPSQAKLVLFWPKSPRFCVLGHFTSQNRLLIEHSGMADTISIQRNGEKYVSKAKLSFIPPILMHGGAEESYGNN